MLLLIAAGGKNDETTVAEDLAKINVPIIRQTVTPFLNDSKCPYRWTSQPFGLADNSTDGYGKYHTGVDVACRSGAKIIAPFNCLVIKAVNNNATSGGWGTNVICKGMLPNGHKVCLRVAHMIYDSLRVKVGDVIHAGQTIGLEGSTGAGTGVHAHIQIMECDGDYQEDIDSGYAAKRGFMQYRYFYNPLRFFDDFKDPHVVHSNLNFARHIGDGRFASYSWISTTPNYLSASDWTNLSTNGWQLKLDKRGYGNRNSDRIYYKSKYLVTDRSNYRVVFKPYLPHSGYWKASYKIPRDSSLNGTVLAKLNWRAPSDGKYGSMRHAVYRIRQSSQQNDKYVKMGGFFYCNKGKDCSVEVTTEQVGLVGIEEIKWEYVAPAFENLQGWHYLTESSQQKEYKISEDTEFGIIRLEYWPGTEHFNIDLYADLLKPDGTRIPLPCFRTNIHGKREHCIFLNVKKGEKILARTHVPNPPYCDPSNRNCYAIGVFVSRFKGAKDTISMPPHKYLLADVGTAQSWYSPWLYKASAAGLITGVCGEDYHTDICLYRPAKQVNKAEFTKMLISAIGIHNPRSCRFSPYNDVSTSSWYCPFVAELKKRLPAGFVWDGFSPNNFFPDQKISRETAAFMSYAALGIPSTYERPRDDRVYCDVAAIGYRDAIYTLFRHNIMIGNHTAVFSTSCLYDFKPTQILNRAMAAKIAFKVFEYAYNNDIYRR